MGVKRISRGKLFDTEKLGQLVDVDTGAALKNAIVSTTQHREGNKLITDIVVDLGTSKGTILTAGEDAQRPCGEASGLARLCKVTQGVFGVVTEVRSFCLEAPTTNGTAYANSLTLMTGSSGTGTQGAATDSPGHIVLGKDIGSAVGKDITYAYDANDLNSKSFYIGSAMVAGTKVSGSTTLTIADATEAAHFNDGSRLTLFDETGTKFEMIIDKTNLDYNATGVPFKIGLKSADNLAKLEEGFQRGIEATNSNFNVSHSPDSGVLTIDSKTASGAEGNNASHGNDNSYTANGSETATITINNFTGGTTTGKTAADADATFTGGKFLFRFTGFVVPDDL